MMLDGNIDRVQQLTPSKLSRWFGGTERWWQRRLPELVETGVVSKRGRLFWGHARDVERWLVGGSAGAGKSAG